MADGMQVVRRMFSARALLMMLCIRMSMRWLRKGSSMKGRGKRVGVRVGRGIGGGMRWLVGEWLGGVEEEELDRNRLFGYFWC